SNTRTHTHTHTDRQLKKEPISHSQTTVNASITSYPTHCSLTVIVSLNFELKRRETGNRPSCFSAPVLYFHFPFSVTERKRDRERQRERESQRERERESRPRGRGERERERERESGCP